MATRQTSKKTNTKKTAKNKSKRSATLSASSTSNTAATDATAVLHSIRAQGAEDVAALSGALAAAHVAQESLTDAYAQLAILETQQEETFAAALSDVTSERDTVRSELVEAQAAQQQELKAVAQAAKTLRSTANVLCNIPDPLTPLIDEDDDSDLIAVRERLQALVAQMANETVDVPTMSSVIAASKELGEALSLRVKAHIKRVKQMRKENEQLQQAGVKQEQTYEQLCVRSASLQENLDSTQTDLQDSESLTSQLREDIEAAELRYSNLDADKTDSEDAAESQHESLQQECDSAVGRGDELARKLKDSRELARKTERTTVDLAELVLSLANTDVAMTQTQISEIPPMTIAKDELESFIGDASDDWDDEVDNLFAEDLGDDIVGAARTVAESLRTRRQALVTELVDSNTNNVTLTDTNEQHEQHIEETENALHDVETALNSANAQLESLNEDIEAQSQELSERSKELSDTQSTLADVSLQAEHLQEQVAEGVTLKAELKSCSAEIQALHKASDKQSVKNDQVDAAQRDLARHLVEVAGASESTLSGKGTSNSNRTLNRFTKSYQKLDETAAQADSGMLPLLKSSLDVVEKLHVRMSQLTHELHEKNETVEAYGVSISDLETRISTESKTLSEREGTLKTLKIDNQELNKVAKKAAKLETQLAKRDTQLAQAQAQLTTTAAELLDTQADYDEVIAREEESMSSLSGDMSDMKRRLQSELRARQDGEASASEEREDNESRITVLQTTVDALSINLEERDDHIIELQAGMDEAGEQRARIAELEHRSETLDEDLEVALARSRELEEELDSKGAMDTLEEELQDAHGERDGLIAKVRALEKIVADSKGTVASVNSKNDSLHKKIDEKASVYRRDLEKLQTKYDDAIEENRRNKVSLAGMAARTRRTSTMG